MTELKTLTRQGAGTALEPSAPTRSTDPAVPRPAESTEGHSPTPRKEAEAEPPVPDLPAVPVIAERSPRHILYRLWNGVVPPAVCQAVIDTFEEQWFQDATIQAPDGAALVDERTRRAGNQFIEPGHWTGALASHFAHQANLLWRFDLTALGTLSILRYEASGHFEWHTDVLAYEQADYPGIGSGLERKLSVTVNLSDPGDYEGGDLQFLNGTGQLLTQSELRERGSVVVFPSTLGHRVTPITSGVRYALVGWMVGPPLR